MEKSIYRSICYYGLPDEDYLFVSFDDFTVLYIEARTARITFQPPFPLSISPPALLCVLVCIYGAGRSKNVKMVKIINISNSCLIGSLCPHNILIQE